MFNYRQLRYDDVEEDKDFDFIRSLNCQILITTRNKYEQYSKSASLQHLELESLPIHELLSIFKNEYGYPLSDWEEKTVEKIINKFGNLTMIVPMIL